MRVIIGCLIPALFIFVFIAYGLGLLASALVSGLTYFTGLRLPSVVQSAAPFFGLDYRPVGDTMRDFAVKGQLDANYDSNFDDPYDPLSDDLDEWFITQDGYMTRKPTRDAAPMPRRARWFEIPYNKDIAEKGGVILVPDSYRGRKITAVYGQPMFYTNFHLGIDFSMPTGTPLRPFATGLSEVLLVADMPGGYGKYVVLSHGIGGERYLTLYAHLSEIRVTQGQILTPNDVIGLSGNTGNSKGPHLHFEVLKQAPDGRAINVDPCSIPSFSETLGACR